MLDDLGFIKDRGVIDECIVDGCTRPHATRGLCMIHYNKQRQEGYLAKRPESTVCQECQTPLEVASKGPIPRRCQKCRSREYRKSVSHRATVLRRYGLTENDYQLLLSEQNARCAICDGPPNGNGAEYSRFSIDHDHETGFVRGLLCGTCNSGLGMFKDDPFVCELAADYLRSGRKTQIWSEGS